MGLGRVARLFVVRSGLLTAVVMTMPAVHEDMQQRTGQYQEIRQRSEKVRRVAGVDEKGEDADRNSGKAIRFRRRCDCRTGVVLSLVVPNIG